MDIKEIKSRLSINVVLTHYGIKADHNHRLACPFHADKTPSMQVYYATNTVYCFSSNCTTHGKSLDVIDFVMRKDFDKLSPKEAKQAAIEKCKTMLGTTTTVLPQVPLLKDITPHESIDRIHFLSQRFSYFKNAIHNSKPAKDYLHLRGLDPTIIEVGYNAAQYHHGKRRDPHLINGCVTLGLLSPWGVNNRDHTQAYRVFGSYCLVFALRNQADSIVSLYFRSTINDDKQKHFYLKDRQGLYPAYPEVATKVLLLTESVIDAATLLQWQKKLPHGDNWRNASILACYGTNGLMQEHKDAIQHWSGVLSPSGRVREGLEIIFCFDADEAGETAQQKYSEELQELVPHVSISRIVLPNKDVNETHINHEESIFNHLLATRVVVLTQSLTLLEPPAATPEENNSQATPVNEELDSSNPHKLLYKGQAATYYILGGISKPLDSMKVTLAIDTGNALKSRYKIDLYEDKQVEKIAKEASEKLQLRKDQVEKELYMLTDVLDSYREALHQQEKEASHNENETSTKPNSYYLTAQEKTKVESFLKHPELLPRLNNLLGQAGIVGEENNRLFLLLIAMSYKMPEPLHALIQGSSGSGKTRLLKQISDCIPPEKVTKLTRVSDKVLYNYPERYFVNRLLCLEDIDGLSEEAEFAFRELQSNGELNSATSTKLDNGQIVAGQKTVKGPIASLACTTRGELYEDNMSRVFLVAVDESSEQTQRVIYYQNNKSAGMVDSKKEHSIKRFVQLLIRELKAYEVINPYAHAISLPPQAHKIRRLNDLFLNFIKMVTLLHQQQRNIKEGIKLVSTIEDVEAAIHFMFESIVLKVDELDGSLRQFYEQLKIAIEKKGRNYAFTRFDVKQATGLGKTQLQYYLNKLVSLEYIRQEGFANRGFTYRIVHWDNHKSLRQHLKNQLQAQVNKIKTEHQVNANRTPADVL